MPWRLLGERRRNVRGRAHIDGNLIGDGAAGAGRHDAGKMASSLWPVSWRVALVRDDQL
jgi:hypothetical protein